MRLNSRQLVGALILLGTAVLLVFLIRPPTDPVASEPLSASVASFSGDAFACAHEGGCTTAAITGARVYIGGEAWTGATGKADLQTDSVVFRLDPLSKLQFTDVTDAVTQVTVWLGRLFVSHDPQGRDQIYVKAGRTLTTALDTRFSVAVDDAVGTVDGALDRGVYVAVPPDGGQVIVHLGTLAQRVVAGEELYVPPGATALPAPQPINADEVARWNAVSCDWQGIQAVLTPGALPPATGCGAPPPTDTPPPVPPPPVIDTPPVFPQPPQPPQPPPPPVTRVVTVVVTVLVPQPFPQPFPQPVTVTPGPVTETPTNTLTPTATPTGTPTNTPTDTPQVVTVTVTLPPAIVTDTPPPLTDTPTNTMTPTHTPTHTLTPTHTPTWTPTWTPTSTPTNTPTDTPVSPTPSVGQSAPDTSPYRGVWLNFDPKATPITRMEISPDGSWVYVDWFAACGGTVCDLGRTSAQYFGPPLKIEVPNQEAVLLTVLDANTIVMETGGTRVLFLRAGTG